MNTFLTKSVSELRVFLFICLFSKMHCDWPIDFYEDCATPPSDILINFFENVDAPLLQDNDPDPAFIHAATQTLEPSHDSDHLSNVTTDVSDDEVENLLSIENILSVLHQEYIFSDASHGFSDNASTPGSSSSLAMSDTETQYYDDSNDVLASPDYFETSSPSFADFSSEDNFSIPSSEMLENTEDDILSQENTFSQNSEDFGDSHPDVYKEESECSVQNSCNEQNESQQSVSSRDCNSKDNVEEHICNADDAALLTGQHSSTDENHLVPDISNETIVNEAIPDTTKNIEVSGALSNNQFSNTSLPKPSTSKCNNEDTFIEVCVMKKHDDVPSTSEREKSKSQNFCDIPVKEENNEESRVLESNLVADDSNCMKPNSMLENNYDNSYHEDSMIYSSLTRNINSAEGGTSSSSGPDKSVSKLKHKIEIDSEDIVPNKVPKYSSETVSVSKNKLRDQ